ncbi:PLD nuclease N-terminal domain-containing protein [Phycicoccus avicenniae]|uniref:PLD nuclease N-terminal domain-containing protein n=1 Tax=Phycicoccus avicenniae TaxID=2828860 RepID=UPI003D266B00
MLRYLPYVLSLALTVYCLIDCLQSDESSIRNLPKIAWVLLVLLFPIVGPVAWLVAGRPERGARSRTQQERWDDHRRSRDQRGSGPSRPPRGPDDDPDFLKGL